MNKKLPKMLVLLFAILFAAITLTSCFSSQKEKTLYEKIINTLETMESFQTNAYVKYISNNKNNTYKTFQQAKASGEYRIEVTAPESVAGNITVFDGKVISQFNKSSETKVSTGTTDSAERLEILITSFVKNYLASKETATVTVGKIENTDETVLEAKIPGNHQYLSTEKLWIDNKTLKPVELIIYDVDGNERVIVNFQDFEYNVKFENDIFLVKAAE